MYEEDRAILKRLRDMICKYVLLFGPDGGRKIGGKSKEYDTIADLAGRRVGDNPQIYKRQPRRWYRVHPKGVWR